MILSSRLQHPSGLFKCFYFAYITDFCKDVGVFHKIFTSRFTFWALFGTQLINIILMYVFLIIQDLRSQFTTQSLKHRFYFENSSGRLNELRAQISYSSVRLNKIEEAEINLHKTINDILMTFQSRSAKVDLLFLKYPQKGFKTIISYCLQYLEELQKVRKVQKTTHAWRRHRSELTKKAWENAAQGLSKFHVKSKRKKKIIVIKGQENEIVMI